jgi:dipeptidase E
MKGAPYLSWPLDHISDFLDTAVTEILFIPYAAVTFPYEEYEEMVQGALTSKGYTVRSIHRFDDPVQAVHDAQAIAIGGGNTFKLLANLYSANLIEPLRAKIKDGTPYMGWSAGSNMACPSIRTTNDMPIVEPASFEALNVIDYQINPHYTDATIEGHGGESRDQRLTEFLAANQDMKVIGLPEGCGLRVEEDGTTLIGGQSLFIFKYGKEREERSGL